MKKLFVALTMLGEFKISAQLSGSAILNGQSNHAGIKVRFIAGSATAATDSVLTNTNGSYSLNISGGLYTVVFSKPGFQTLFYNNNTSVVLSNTTAIPAVNLTPGNSMAVTGTVSGLWSSNTLYVVNGPITLPSGMTLTIQPGTQIKFNGNFIFEAFGVLTAVGNSNAPIHFNSFKSQPAPGDWGGINLHNSSSNVQNCIIENCLFGLGLRDCSAPVFFNEIRSVSSYGIYLSNSSSLVKQNIIHGFGQGIANEPTGSTSSPTVECNEIYDGGIGLQFHKSGLIKNNIIYQIGVYGIECNFANTSRLENNYIHHCGVSGIAIGENVTPAPAPTIVNNTILNNATGISLIRFHAAGTIINNIIANNTIGVDGDSKTPDAVSNNLMWNNTTSDFKNVQISALGQIVNTNTNGDPVDSYFNVIKDPLFVNNTPPDYSSVSPCRNVGNSAYSPNIGCDANAMCAGMILGVGETEREMIGVFPNPFSSQITLYGLQNERITSAVFYDLTGKTYEATLNKEPGSLIHISKPDLTPGIYFLEISFSDSSKEYIRMIKE